MSETVNYNDPANAPCNMQVFVSIEGWPGYDRVAKLQSDGSWVFRHSKRDSSGRFMFVEQPAFKVIGWREMPKIDSGVEARL